MIKLEKTDIYGWEAAVRGMRNPLNSWDKSDSRFSDDVYETNVQIGVNDWDLMKRLWRAGTDHRKYLRQIMVSVDITAPLYWWKEFDTYKVGTVANSCSTMHKIAAKEFELDDFSHEHLRDDMDVDYVDPLKYTIDALNAARLRYLETKDKKYWWQMIQLLPSSYNQKRTVTMNYEVLANIYKSRKNHKLDEWSKGFCEWIVDCLPYHQLITGEFNDNED